MPCFAPEQGTSSKKSKQAPDAQAVALAACAATCLPQRVVPAEQPQQVHIAFAGATTDSVAVSWTTDANTTRSSVMFGVVGGGAELLAEGNTTSYTFYAGGAVKGYAQHVYTSGTIHHTVLPALQPATQYWCVHKQSASCLRLVHHLVLSHSLLLVLGTNAAAPRSGASGSPSPPPRPSGRPRCLMSSA